MRLETKVVISCVGLLAVMVIAGSVLVPMLTSPSEADYFSRERREQRKIAQDRVGRAGGWGMIRKGCEQLVASYPHGDFVWYPHNDPLPPSMAALQPREVDFSVATKAPTIVSIKLFGTHRTGAHDIPYYGFVVVCGDVPRDYIPAIPRPGRVLSKVTDGVFEVYQ